MNEGWYILGSVILAGAVTAEVCARLLGGNPRPSLLYRLGRGVGMAVKSVLRR